MLFKVQIIFGVIFFLAGLFPVSSEARIRLRKVKEAPRTCKYMTEDPLLSRSDKKVLSTERHSLVFEDSIDLVRDKGEKICQWRPSELNTLGPIENFKFYIDEYKETLFAILKNPDESNMIIKVPLANCSLENTVTQKESFMPPQCQSGKKSSSRKRKKKHTV